MNDKKPENERIHNSRDIGSSLFSEGDGGSVQGSERSRKGREGEEAVAEILAAEGYEILARNFRAGPGEIDIVVWKRPCIVFVEVKNWYRMGATELEQAIGKDKRRRLVETSKIYLCLHRQYNEAFIRYDVFLMRGQEVAGRYESAFAGVV